MLARLMFAESGETSGGHGNAVTTTLGLGQVVPPGTVGMVGTGTRVPILPASATDRGNWGQPG